MTSPTDAHEARAHEAYDKLLRAGHLEETRTRLASGLREHRLDFYERSVCNVLSPFFVSDARHDELTARATSVMRAVGRAAEVLLSTPSLRRALGIEAEKDQHLALDRMRQPEVLGRLDGVVSRGGELKFIEYNPGTPGGFVFADLLCGLFEDMPVVTRLKEQLPLRSLRLASAVPAALTASCRAAGVPTDPTLAIVLPRASGDELATMTELATLRVVLTQAGFRLHVTVGERMERRAGRLFDGDVPLDVLLVLDWDALLGEIDLAHPLWSAIREGTVHLANSLSAWYTRGCKGLFCLLSDPRHTGLFDSDTQRALAATIPWTRHLAEVHTELSGRRVDLIDYVHTHREQLVLKPLYTYGGAGVLLGFTSTQEAWSARIAEALQGDVPFVVQERVELAQRVLPCLVDGQVQWAPRYFDLNPYVWNGSDVAGFMVRVSGDPLLNLSAGTGSMVAPLLCGTTPTHA